VLQLPPTVHAVVRSRLDRLSPRVQSFLAMAAVVGRSFSLHMMQQLVGEGGDTRDSLVVLQEQRLIHQEQQGQRQVFTFNHLIIQEVAYQTLLLERRKELHGRVAIILEEMNPDGPSLRDEELARHWFNADEWGKASHHYQEAAKRAAMFSGHREAVNLLRLSMNALDRLPTGEVSAQQRIDKAILLRHSLFPLGEFQEISNLLEEVASIAEGIGDRRRLGVVRTNQMVNYLGVGKHNDALRVGSQALWIANELRHEKSRRQVLFHLVQANVSLGEYTQAVAQCNSLLNEVGWSPGMPLPDEAFVLLVGLWRLLAMAETGRFAEAHRDAAQAISQLNCGSQPLQVLLAYLGEGLVRFRQGHMADAIASLGKAREVSRQGGMGAWISAVASPLGLAQLYVGNHATGQALLEDAVARSRSNQGAGHAMRLVHLGEASIIGGREREATDLASQAMEISRVNGEKGHLAYAMLLQAKIMVAGERYAPALECLKEAHALATSQSMLPLLARVEHLATRVHAALGQHAESAAAQAAAQSLADRLGLAPFLG